MTDAVPRAGRPPPALVLDGEVVAWSDGEPYFPDVYARVLNRDMTIPLTFVVFDVLGIDGVELTSATYRERHAALEQLDAQERNRATAETLRTEKYPMTAQTILNDSQSID